MSENNYLEKPIDYNSSLPNSIEHILYNKDGTAIIGIQTVLPLSSELRPLPNMRIGDKEI